MGRPAKPTPSAEQLEREALALDLRRAGYEYSQIAEQTGYANASGARKAVQRALKRGFVEPAEDLRTLEADRLDLAHRAVWTSALRGDLKAIDRVVKISDRRSKLLGLDAPTRHDHTVTLDAEQAALIVAVIRGILEDLALTKRQQTIAGEVVTRHLRAIEGGATEQEA